MEIEKAFESESLLYLGAARLSPREDFERFLKWKEEGRHGGLKYLEDNDDLRKDPSTLLSGARSALVFALPYAQSCEEQNPKVALYARFRDYHKLLWEKGTRVGQKLGLSFRVVVDSVPILERSLAAHSGVGFIGKNTCYIHPEKGSLLLLGELITTLECPQKESLDSRLRSAEGGCSQCTSCQEACPTGALSKDYSIDSNLCLSYWTIENRGPIPQEFWPHFDKYWFGCDLCQLACPYTRNAKKSFLPPEIAIRKLPALSDVALMSEAQYQEWFGGTALTRAKRNGLKRNALIAMFVTKDPELERVLRNIGPLDSPLKETVDQGMALLKKESAERMPA